MTTSDRPFRKKLIEVSLPLEAINAASGKEKSIRHGHPSTLHLWWARRPLAACRAVLFASLVDDPSSNPERFPTEEAQERERRRLFDILEELIKWESSTDERVLGVARAEVMRSTGGVPPAVCDPFCGGGSIPLEAQRLGLEAYGSDLNPVAVLISRALIEIPHQFAGAPPVNPKSRQQKLVSSTWVGACGLADDLRYYGEWLHDEAERRLGDLYPKIALEKGQKGEATVIAWLWARTAKCPNPACGVAMPLIRSYVLSTKKGKEAYVQPIVKGSSYRFEVKMGNAAPTPPKVGVGARFRCVCCDQIASSEYVKSEGKAGRMGNKLLAIVAEGQRGRVYVSPSPEHERIAASAQPPWLPEGEIANDGRARGSCLPYGLKTFAHLFTSRQLTALTTFSKLVGDARDRILADARKAGLVDGGGRLEASTYADAIATYLGLGISKLADYNCTLVSWSYSRDQAAHAFTKQALPMVWDFAEVNPLARAAGDPSITMKGIAEALERGVVTPRQGRIQQRDARERAMDTDRRVLVCTDPPYYDNIGYADLSDFFYAWLRPTLKAVYPDLMSTMQVPKDAELVAAPYRFGGDNDKARASFEDGLGQAFKHMRSVQDLAYPLTVFYAFKQTDDGDDERDDEPDVDASSVQVSTGWETMLEGLLKAGFSINGTWPMRTERGVRTIGLGKNALASSVLLVCRPRRSDAAIASRSDFLRALKRELPLALKQLQQGNIAPVDMAQAAIGPGMGVFSRHSKVLEPDGKAMSVRTALQLVNQELDAFLAAQEGDLDRETRFCIAWFEQRGFQEGPFGEADVLARAKNTSVERLVDAGLLRSKGGKVRLLTRNEVTEKAAGEHARSSLWDTTQRLAGLLEREGEEKAAELVRLEGSVAGAARDLAYRLYSICERRAWPQDGVAYNSLVISWPEISRLAAGRERSTNGASTPTLFERE